MRNLIQLFLMVFILFSCNGKEKLKSDTTKEKSAENSKQQNTNTGWEEKVESGRGGPMAEKFSLKRSWENLPAGLDIRFHGPNVSLKN